MVPLAAVHVQEQLEDRPLARDYWRPAIILYLCFNERIDGDASAQQYHATAISMN